MHWQSQYSNINRLQFDIANIWQSKNLYLSFDILLLLKISQYTCFQDFFQLEKKTEHSEHFFDIFWSWAIKGFEIDFDKAWKENQTSSGLVA